MTSLQEMLPLLELNWYEPVPLHVGVGMMLLFRPIHTWTEQKRWSLSLWRIHFTGVQSGFLEQTNQLTVILCSFVMCPVTVSGLNETAAKTSLVTEINSNLHRYWIFWPRPDHFITEHHLTPNIERFRATFHN